MAETLTHTAAFDPDQFRIATRAQWEAAAQAWHRWAPLLERWLGAATDAMLDMAGVVPGSRVLDIAAGAGEQTLDIARRVGPSGQVLATDISPGILALACHKFHVAGWARASTRVADAQALGLDGAGFDAAVCRLGLMFCGAPQAALASAHAALRPGGRFSALVFGSPQANPCIAILMASAMRHAGLPPPPSPPQSPPPGSLLSLGRPGLLAELLAATGFADIEVRALPAPMRLPSVQHYLDFVRSAGLPIMAILAPLTPEVQQAAWHDIAQQLARFNANGQWVGPNELLLCSATRATASAVFSTHQEGTTT